MADLITIGSETIAPGEQKTVRLSIPALYTHTEVPMAVRVIRGKQPGPQLFVSAALHGDELNGVEIIRRLLQQAELKRLRGTLLIVPVVNVYGYMTRSRYLPDRRDLNRSFPGSATGSMASRLAHLFMNEVVGNSTHGIDLHTGALHRPNMPHLRVADDEAAMAMAAAFRAPMILRAGLRDGSLRAEAQEDGVPVLLYEAGEALRFDENAIRIGLRGVLGVMRSLGMLPRRKVSQRVMEAVFAPDSRWVRAPESGTFLATADLGQTVRRGDVLGTISSPLGDKTWEIRAPQRGVVIGRTMLPVVYEGEAVMHIAELEQGSAFQPPSSSDAFDGDLQG